MPEKKRCVLNVSQETRTAFDRAREVLQEKVGGKLGVDTALHVIIRDWEELHEGK